MKKINHVREKSMKELTLFAKRLKKAREQRGMKQKELAEKIDVTPQTISAY